ncbi:MAG: hypothetical protein WCC60_22000 [Ilumatobacteraceae bacterium]
MADLVIVTIIIAFTTLAVAYISWCDRIIGPDESSIDVTPPPDATATPEAPHERSAAGGVAVVSA